MMDTRDFKISRPCGQWMPVTGSLVGSGSVMLISMPCTHRDGHDGPHGYTIKTEDGWETTVSSHKREPAGDGRNKPTNMPGDGV